MEKRRNRIFGIMWIVLVLLSANVIVAHAQDAKKTDAQIVTDTKSFAEFSAEVSKLVKENTFKNISKDTSTGRISLAAVNDEFYSKRLIVKAKVDDLKFAKYGATAVVKSTDNVYIVQFDSKDATKKAMEALNKLSTVNYAEPDRYHKCINTDTMTINSLISSTINSTISNKINLLSYCSWGVTKIGANEYAKYVKAVTSKSITVAVVDTGVSNHPLMEGRIVSGGYDFVANDYNPTDENFHGTHVAGTIVDCTPGLKVNILPVRVLDAKGYGYDSIIALGVRYAVQKKVKVINLSLEVSVRSEYLDEQMAYAVKKGVTVVAAAGNDSGNTTNYSPGHVKEAIIVGAVDSNNKRAAFSNIGSSVDVVAPGVNILSCSVWGGYIALDGTSQASPHVAAIAAMYKLVYPSKTPAQIEKLVKKNTKDLGKKGWDKYYGYGIPTLKSLVVPVKVTLNKKSTSVYIGKSITLTATITPSNVANKKITWSSSNKSVATVSSSGVVKGKKAGTVTITAKTSNGKKASCKVTVKVVLASSVKLNKTSASVEKGKTVKLTATIAPSNTTNKSIKWSSSNTGVATVSSTGVVTGKAVGTATITAKTSNGKKASCKITVKPVTVLPTGVKLNISSKTIDVNKTVQLTATITPSNATNKTVTWSSSNKNVATVSSSGLVTGKVAGTATITAQTSNGKTAACTITVKAPIISPTGIELDAEYDELSIGESLQLTATVLPENAADKTVIWSSSDENVATVDENGMVTAISEGSVIITAQTSNGLTVSCYINTVLP